MAKRNSNELLTPAAYEALHRLKMETATELGIPNYSGYLGDLPAKIHGHIGGNMTRKLVKMAEQMISNNQQV